MANEYTPKPVNAGEVSIGAAQVAPSPQQRPMTEDEMLQQQGFKPQAEMTGREFTMQQLGMAQQGAAPEGHTGAAASALRGTFNTAGSIANLMGAEDWKTAADTLAAKFPSEQPEFAELKSWGELGTYAMERGLENVANMLVVTGATLAGGVPGTAVGSGLLAAGETAQAIDESGAERTVANMVPATVINTAMETFSALKLFKNSGLAPYFFEAVDKAAETTGIGKMIGKGIMNTGKSAFTEGSTELAQTYVNQVNAELANNEAFMEALRVLPKEQRELLEAGAGGFFGGAMTTAAGQTINVTTESIKLARNTKSRAAPVQETEIPPDTPTEVKDEVEAEQQAAAQDEALANPDEPAPEVEPSPLETLQEETQAQPKPEDLSPDAQLTALNEAIARNMEGLEVAVDNPIPAGVAFTEATGQQADSVGVIEASQYENAAPGIIQASEMPDTVSQSNLSYVENGVMQSSVIKGAKAQTGSNRTYIKGDGKKLYGYSGKTVIELANVVEAWRQKYLPNRSIILGEQIAGKDRKVSGMHSPMIDVAEYDIQRAQGNMDITPVSYININPHVIREQLTSKMSDSGNKPSTREVQGVVMSTLAHEFGHAMIAQEINETTPEVRTGLKQEHREMLVGLKEKSFKEGMEQITSTADFGLLGVPDRILNMPFKEVAERYWSVESLEYLLSFDEYAAEQVAKKFSKDLEGIETPFMQSIMQKLKEFYKDFMGLFGNQIKFNTWIETIGLKNKANDLVLQIPIKNEVPSDLKEISDSLKTKGINLEIRDDMQAPMPNASELLTQDMIEAMRRTEHVHTGFSKLGFLGLTPLQIAERYKVPEAAAYMESVMNWAATKMRGIVRADEVTKEWRHLSVNEADSFSQVLYEASEISDDEGRVLLPSEIESLMREYNLDPAKHMELFNEIQESFKEVTARLRKATEIETLSEFTANPEQLLSELERVGEEGRAEILDIYTQDAETAWEKLSEVQGQFESLENRTYFPRMRFGNFAITVKRRGQEGSSDLKERTEIFEVYESKREAEQALRTYQAEYAGAEYNIELGRMTDTAQAMYGMPQVVVRSIGDKLRNAEGGLTENQEKALSMAESDLSPGKAFLRQLRKRKNTKGFSRDAQRTFSSYMNSASNHLARIEHSRSLVDGLAKLARAAKQVQGDITDLNLMHQYYQEHFKYIFNPGQDFAQLRSTAFHWFLGFNVKSAVVNLTQPILTTLPYLSAHYGDRNAAKSMAKATRLIMGHMAKKAPLNAAHQRLLDRLTQAGIIDESAASDLAASSESGSWVQNNRVKHGLETLSQASSYMFRGTEKMNRRITALATFDMHMEQTGDFEQSYKATVNAIQRTLFEYAKWNRPVFQRHPIAGAALVFTTYTQQFLFLALNGARTGVGRRAAGRTLGLALVAGGLMGLPGMEYIFKLISAGGTALAGLLGFDDPRFDMEEEIHDAFAQAGMDPGLILNGASSQYGLGPLHLMSLFGAPVPNVNISGSLSMGQPIPGVREIPGNPGLGDYVMQAGGALTSIANNIYKGVSSDDPNSWKRSEKFMPVAMKNLSKAARHLVQGEERVWRSGQFKLYDGNSPEAWAEMIAEAAGFPLTEVGKQWELYGEQRVGSLYYTQRKQGLLERLNYQRYYGDKEGIAEAMQDIRAWNESLKKREVYPYKISGKDMKQSYNGKIRTLEKRKRGLPTTNRDRLFYQERADVRDDNS